jgi:hypothetical protein
LLLAGLAPSTAGAALIGNPDMDYDTADFGTGCIADQCLFLQKKLPGATLRAPFSGTITKWRVGSSGGDDDYQLVVLRKRKGGKFKAVGASYYETTPNVGTFTFTTRLPIKKGDSVGIRSAQITGRGFLDGPGTFTSFDPALALGTAGTPDSPIGGGLLYNATIKR